jgi:hypothetical protein
MTCANSPWRCTRFGFSVSGGVGERQCLDLSERMFAAVEQAEARMAAKSTPLFYG